MDSRITDLSLHHIYPKQELYVSSNKRDKMAISRSIVEAVRARKPPGRFLEKDVDTGLWFDIGDKKAIEKTSQALRDGAAAYRRQLSDDMSDPNFLEAVFDAEAEGDHSKVRGLGDGLFCMVLVGIMVHSNL